MRFMMIVKGDDRYEKGQMPTEQELREMGEYNEELVEAGVMLAGEGLHPTGKGFKVNYDGGTPVVIDGPFTETKELIAGYWIIQVESREEAVDWARRIPFHEGEVEVRQLFEIEDFGDELTPELREQEERHRREVEKRAKGVR